MKKMIFLLLMVFTVVISNGQAYLLREKVVNSDTVRTQIRMAVIENAVAVVDTATNERQRLARYILANPTNSIWFDMFAYQVIILLSTATPTDAQVKTIVVGLWNRTAILNTTR